MLAAQFESFRDPFIILAGSVPLAVVRRAAVLVPRLDDAQHLQPGRADHARRPGREERHPHRRSSRTTCRRPGSDKLAAVIEAAGTRLRPILMTTAATVVGHFPLVIATGPGAGARNSIGIMLVSGMIIGTLFTLFVVPSIYMLRGAARVRGRRPSVATRRASVPAAGRRPV